MKKLLTILCCMFLLAGCGSSDSSNESNLNYSKKSFSVGNESVQMTVTTRNGFNVSDDGTTVIRNEENIGKIEVIDKNSANDIISTNALNDRNMRDTNGMHQYVWGQDETKQALWNVPSTDVYVHLTIKGETNMNDLLNQHLKFVKE